MTLDEAIQHAEEVAEKNEKRLDKEGNPYYEKCERCAAEHRQLAEWLKELKQLREQQPCEDTIGRQAAIDATWFEPSYTDPLNVLTEVRDRLKALPSAQPEITRCKDCEHWTNDDCPFAWGKVEDAFCSYAERRTDR